MPQSTPKILIISSDTGGGHRSAAQAISDGFTKFWKSESQVVKVIEGVEESLAREAMTLAAQKLPIKTKFVSRADLEGGIV